MSGVANSRKPLVMGGKLKLKGSSGGSSKQLKRPETSASSSSSGAEKQERHEEHKVEGAKSSVDSTVPGEEYLTASQKRHLQRKIEMEKLEAKKLSKTSFRDRVDQFNNKLAQMTEHNDIPRISAAGNG